MTTLHEDAHVEEAEQAEQVAEVTGSLTGGATGCLTDAASKAGPEAAPPQPTPLVTADKCQAASKLQPKEHHLEQPQQPQQPHALTVSDYKITPIYWVLFFSP